jgi:hypothetical protein
VPGPVELGNGGTSLDIEGGQVRVDAQASPLDDLLDSATTAGFPDTPGTEGVNTAGTESANTNTPNSANTNSPDTANTVSADTGTGDSPPTPDSPDTAPGARTGTPGGAGLGLSIAASLVKAMGGDISVASLGGGATFTVRLPSAAGLEPAPSAVP